MKSGIIKFLTIAIILTIIIACGKENPVTGCDDCQEEDELIQAEYDPQPYTIEVPDWMPDPFIPADNPMTVDGVELGRHLFFDPILSSDSTQSCASCHDPELAFTDGLAVSTGVLGIAGRPSAMSLANLAGTTVTKVSDALRETSQTMTTGATADEIAKILRKAGAARVEVAVVARGIGFDF